MKIDITQAYTEAIWFDISEGVRFKIRPYPASKESFGLSDTGDIIFSGKQQLAKFTHCLVDWEGVLVADGKPLPCDDKVKTIVYEAKLGDIHSVVFSKLRDMEQRRDEVVKN